MLTLLTLEFLLFFYTSCTLKLPSKTVNLHILTTLYCQCVNGL